MNYNNNNNNNTGNRQDNNQMNRYVTNHHPSYLTINNNGQLSHVTVSGGQMAAAAAAAVAQIPQSTQQHIQLQNYSQNSTIYQLAQVGVLPPNTFRLHNSTPIHNGNTIITQNPASVSSSSSTSTSTPSSSGITTSVPSSNSVTTSTASNMDVNNGSLHCSINSGLSSGMNNIGVYSLSAAPTTSLAPACNISNKNINIIAAALSSSLHGNNNNNIGHHHHHHHHNNNNEDNVNFLANVIASDSSCANASNNTSTITALSTQPQSAVTAAAANLCGSASMLARMAGMENVSAGTEWFVPNDNSSNGGNGFVGGNCLQTGLSSSGFETTARANTCFNTSAQGKYNNEGKEFRVDNVFLLCPCCNHKLKLSVEIKDDKTGIELVAVNEPPPPLALASSSGLVLPMAESKPTINCNLVQQARYERDSIKMVLNNNAIFKNQPQSRKNVSNQRSIITTSTTTTTTTTMSTTMATTSPLIPKNVILHKTDFKAMTTYAGVDGKSTPMLFTGEPDMMNSMMNDLLIKPKTKKRKRGERRVLHCNNRGCDMNFETLQELNEHLQSHKSDVYECTWSNCGREFSKIEELFCHFRNSHSDQSKAFKCPCCEKAFVDAKQLRNHYRLHTDERPYSCDWEGCQAKFRRCHHLTAHKRIHTGEKPYECDFEGCEQKFTKSYHLKRHILNHVNSSDPSSSMMMLNVTGEDHLHLHQPQQQQHNRPTTSVATSHNTTDQSLSSSGGGQMHLQQQSTLDSSNH